jgi:hypothetical protein
MISSLLRILQSIAFQLNVLFILLVKAISHVKASKSFVMNLWAFWLIISIQIKFTVSGTVQGKHFREYN